MNIAFIIIVSPRDFWNHKMTIKLVTRNFLGSTTCPYFNLEIYPKLCRKGKPMEMIVTRCKPVLECKSIYELLHPMLLIPVKYTPITIFT